MSNLFWETRGMSIKEKLEFRSKDVGKCREWTGSVSKRGYGYLRINKTSYRVHRLAYETFCGGIPEGMCVLHSCDNRKCINPEHLFVGTNADNTKDMIGKGRMAVGEALPQSILTANEVIKIKKMIEHKIPQTEIARNFNVARTTISSISTGKSWAHVCA